MSGKDNNNLVGNRIKELRKKNKESQEHLAEVLGLTQSGISKIESGHSRLSLDLQLKIAEHYGISPNYLCSGKDNDTVLETLKKYIRFTFTSTSLGEESFLCPIMILDSSLYEYLFQFALADKEKNMPKEIHDKWLDLIEKNFHETNKDNHFDDTVSFIPLPPNLIYPEDYKSDWKQTDLLRELHNQLFLNK